MKPATQTLASAFQEHRSALWALCYRMTGSASEADDVVQSAFERLAHTPPRQFDTPLRPWLWRVAVNLCVDRLRQRRRTQYVGPWLPEPVETDVPQGEADPLAGPEAQYGLRESAAFAFLVAMEALTPRQRAVLLLRDVFDYSVAETAQCLGCSEEAVKQTHRRARLAMVGYASRRQRISEDAHARHRGILERFFSSLAQGDTSGAEQLLTAEVELLTDGGGEFHAALRVVHGPRNVIRFFQGTAAKADPNFQVEVLTLNGLPALRIEQPKPPSHIAPLTAVLLELEGDRIRALHLVLASTKVQRLRRIS